MLFERKIWKFQRYKGIKIFIFLNIQEHSCFDMGNFQIKILIISQMYWSSPYLLWDHPSKCFFYFVFGKLVKWFSFILSLGNLSNLVLMRLLWSKRIRHTILGLPQLLHLGIGRGHLQSSAQLVCLMMLIREWTNTQ